MRSGPSVDQSHDGDGDATTDDGGVAKRLKIAKKIVIDDTSEKAEERRLQREQECIGGGFSNSSWIAAIDNSGETLCLHSSESVQLVPIRDDQDSELSRMMESNPQADDQQSHRSSS